MRGEYFFCMCATVGVVYNNIINSVLYLSMFLCWNERLKCIYHQRGSHLDRVGPQQTDWRLAKRTMK